MRRGVGVEPGDPCAGGIKRRALAGQFVERLDQPRQRRFQGGPVVPVRGQPVRERFRAGRLRLDLLPAGGEALPLGGDERRAERRRRRQRPAVFPPGLLPVLLRPRELSGPGERLFVGRVQAAQGRGEGQRAAVRPQALEVRLRGLPLRGERRLLAHEVALGRQGLREVPGPVEPGEQIVPRPFRPVGPGLPVGQGFAAFPPLLLREQVDRAERLFAPDEVGLPPRGFLVGQRAQFRINFRAREAFQQFGALVGPGAQEPGELALRQHDRAQEAPVVEADDLLDQFVRPADLLRQRHALRVIEVALGRLELAVGPLARAAQVPLRPEAPGGHLEVHGRVALAAVAAHHVLGGGSVAVARGPSVERQRDGVEQRRFARAGRPRDREEADPAQGGLLEVHLVRLAAAQGVEVLELDAQNFHRGAGAGATPAAAAGPRWRSV